VNGRFGLSFISSGEDPRAFVQQFFYDKLHERSFPGAANCEGAHGDNFAWRLFRL